MLTFLLKSFRFVSLHPCISIKDIFFAVYHFFFLKVMKDKVIAVLWSVWWYVQENYLGQKSLQTIATLKHQESKTTFFETHHLMSAPYPTGPCRLCVI